MKLQASTPSVSYEGTIAIKYNSMPVLLSHTETVRGVGWGFITALRNLPSLIMKLQASTPSVSYKGTIAIKYNSMPVLLSHTETVGGVGWGCITALIDLP